MAEDKFVEITKAYEVRLALLNNVQGKKVVLQEYR